ncbi:MAG: amidohydrolase family protein [Xanthomonadales bacterium]|nr:amidohydrolase family protein [Xanthomonadales bacterium]
MTHRFDPDGQRLPIKLDSTSNAEYEPIPLEPHNQYANVLAHEAAEATARRLNVSRRGFLVSACGVASTLLAINRANASAGRRAGFFEVSSEAPVEGELAAAELGKQEFIFDVQGHYVPPSVAASRKTKCSGESEPVSREYMRCLGADSFIKDVFLDADTDMMVLSFVPSRRDAEPLTIEEAAATRDIVEAMDGSHRLLLHGRVNPNQEGDLEDMDELAERWGVKAWKTYTQWGPDGEGFWMDDEVGIRFIERARSLGVKNICIHKGIPFGRRSYEHSLCTDIGRVAKAYPDVNFLIYHSGWIPGQPEGPYDPDRGEGIDELIKSLEENGVGRNSNVYAELGSTWRGLMRDVDSAAHGLGKLLKHVGEDNVLWGTDSIWYGSPQDQIQAFRTFQLSPELREAHGYPEITPELRAKVFGLNALKPYAISIDEAKRRAANDPISRGRANYAEDPDPHYLTFGPKDRREFLRFLALGGGNP